MLHREKKKLIPVSVSCFKNQEQLDTLCVVRVWKGISELAWNTYICLCLCISKSVLHHSVSTRSKSYLLVSDQMPDAGFSKDPKFRRLKNKHFTHLASCILLSLDDKGVRLPRIAASWETDSLYNNIPLEGFSKRKFSFIFIPSKPYTCNVWSVPQTLLEVCLGSKFQIGSGPCCPAQTSSLLTKAKVGDLSTSKFQSASESSKSNSCWLVISYRVLF